MVRLSVSWLLSGFVIGGLMLTDRAVPGAWRAWLAPSHGHMLFVGWFLQFVLGIAYWLLPRKRSSDRPLGYDERISWIGVGGLNAGLVLRMLGEPLERTGRGNLATLAALFGSAALQLAAVLIFVTQIWPRMGLRQLRPRQ